MVIQGLKPLIKEQLVRNAKRSELMGSMFVSQRAYYLNLSYPIFGLSAWLSFGFFGFLQVFGAEIVQNHVNNHKLADFLMCAMISGDILDESVSPR